MAYFTLDWSNGGTGGKTAPGDGNADRDIRSVLPCVVSGALIATPVGARTAQELQAGDSVMTRDNGIQQILWINHAVAPATHMVWIGAGALGNGLPLRDMLVSPDQRMLILSEMAALYFKQSEVLVAAKHLIGRDGIDVVKVPATAYVQILFTVHQIVLADGAWTESFQPGEHSLLGIGAAQRTEVFALLPELATAEGVSSYRPARRVLRREEAALLA